MVDYYRLLHVSSEASSDEIRKAFRKEAKKYHPDLYQNISSEERQKRQKHFVLLTQAYETLSDSEHRREYDSKYQQSNYTRSRQRNQKSYTSTSSYSQSRTYRQKSGTQETGTSANSSPPDDDESLEDLIHDVEDLLSRFGLSFKDPLEILVDWAKKVFQELINAWNEEPQSNTEKNGASFSGSHHTTPLEEIEIEIQRLKQQMNTRKKSFHSESNTEKSRKKTDPVIEKELNALKKKYGRL